MTIFYTGVYQVTIDENEFSSKLGITGVYSFNVTPRGLKLVSTTTDYTAASWHYRHIRSYAKSTNRQVILHIGSSRTTGHGGKLVLVTGSSKEMFSMIHRNIKILKAAKEREKEAQTKNEADDITERMRQKDADTRTKRSLRPRSKVYELQQLKGVGDPTKRRSRLSFIEQDRVGEDLIQLEGFAEGQENDDELQQFLDSLDPVMQLPNTSQRFDPSPMLESINSLSSDVYGSHSFSPSSKQQGKESVDHSVPPPIPPRISSNSSNPFLNVDPFNTSTRGSFYNSQEDIFDNFDTVSSPQKTSTPSINQSTTNPFVASTAKVSDPRLKEGIQHLNLSPGGDYTYARHVKPKKRMSTEEFDKVWEDITSDLNTSDLNLS